MNVDHGDAAGELGRLTYEAHDENNEPEHRIPWRDLHRQDKAEWAAVESTVRADERAAALASLKLDKNITAYEVAIVLESVKDARRVTAPDHYDSHIDGINYRAFALLLSGAQAHVPTAREMVAALNKMGDE